VFRSTSTLADPNPNPNLNQGFSQDFDTIVDLSLTYILLVLREYEKIHFEQNIINKDLSKYEIILKINDNMFIVTQF
jgi:hypothetical protein